MSLELERAAIGATLYPEMLDDALSFLTERHFSTELHRSLFRSIAEVSSGGVPCLSSVSHQTKLNGLSGAANYLAECQEAAPMPHQLKGILARLNDEWRKREAIDLARRIHEHEGSADELDAMISRHADGADPKPNAEKVSAILKPVFVEMEQRAMNRGTIPGMPTGFSKLDRSTGGLRGGNLIVVAARPSIGKTAMALNIIETVCIRHKKPTLFISLEMGKEELTERLLLSMSNVPSTAATTGDFSQANFAKMFSTSELLADAPLYINDTAALTMQQIRSATRAAQRRHGIAVVVIDYLGLVGGGGKEYDRITEASKDCKRMAKDLNIPVIAVHQLNRGSEQRQEKRPTMSDLRSSGQIEQDADIIVLLHREKKEPEEQAEIIVEKNRKGPTGIIPGLWNGPYTRYLEA